MAKAEVQNGVPTLNERKRQWYEESSLGLGRICLKLGLTPNLLTGLSLLCSVASGLSFWKGAMLWGVAWMISSAVLDMLDGSTARAGNLGTVFGGILDHVADRYGEFFILAGITMSGAVHPGWGLFALFGMIIASYTRAAAESIGKIENCAVGVMGRVEKFLLIIAGSIVEHWLPTGRWPKGGWLELALIIVGTASLVTAIQRLVYAKRLLGDKRDV
ncbi:MAG: CDP-alcohol phosphatidyltransferase family protein [candidate division Zixibacteria bacterium]|nr:CDP-alcohol phosphatidyltransferase family protein [candidate division Zixibacteria bacterium]MDH3937465.1 CDP-alcohol phosphatidyltransferase family protein [candidate division Zixibacteria bacterium]MDH4032524.1 CDP-alcohol phosphatidyltransferase family protein [candidate division Zixibacteria bacterium]